MNVITKTTTTHHVNGMNVKELGVADRVQLISDTEKKIAEYEAIKTDAKFVKEEIAKLKALLADAVALFDKKD